MAASTALGVAAAAGTRFLISHYNRLSTPVGLTYNLVDMVVSAIALRALTGVSGPGDTGFIILASRVVGVITGALVTMALSGPIDLMVAIALNATSLAVSLLCALATQGHAFILV